VVGDPNQAIYSWNGADATFLEEFGRHHPGAEVVELRDSYRSTPQVLAVAAAVLAGGGRSARPLQAHRSDGVAPLVVGYQSDLDEAHGIARALREHHRPGRPWSSQAVLVRTNAQAAVLEAAFRRAAIPYRVRGAHRFLDEPDVKDLLRRFDRMQEPLTTTLADLDASVARQRRELLEHATGIVDDDEPLDGAPVLRHRELPDTAAGRRVGAFEQIVRLGQELLVVDPGTRTDALHGWLRTVLLEDGPDAADAVTIATFHAAKGLEWDVVHLAGVEAGLVPISHARTADARREEQRLFYVAVTRAADVLRCSWAKTRTFGSDPVDRAPSPYLAWVRGVADDLARADTPAPAADDLVAQTRAALAPAAGRSADDTASEAEPPVDDVARRSAVASALRAWRADQARRADVRPTVVLSDRAVDAIATACPRRPEDLERLRGLGPLTRDRHGARLLEIVAEQIG
jgi:DNA helicase-2/ATP-dependent DNA helicase PcrA